MFGWFKRTPADPEAPYRIYTTAFDRVLGAETLLNEAAAVRPFGIPDERMLEAIRSPTSERVEATQDALAFQRRWKISHALGGKPLVTLLIDHSGSMHGPPALAAATTAEIVGRMLEVCGIDFEILGFTTSSWRGGRARRRWRRRFGPSHPGRLCDLLHIVYRDAAKPRAGWYRGLPLLMVNSILKENVDGEALEWASGRAVAFGASTWVCLVISDGAPVDDSTLHANDLGILGRHLESVITAMASDANIRLGGLGLGFEYDVGRFYATSSTVGILAEAPRETIRLLSRLIWRDEEPLELKSEGTALDGPGDSMLRGAP